MGRQNSIWYFKISNLYLLNGNNMSEMGSDLSKYTSFPQVNPQMTLRYVFSVAVFRFKTAVVRLTKPE